MGISSSVVFEHDFDPAVLDQIKSLRLYRLGLAKSMLDDVAKTLNELSSRGLVSGPDAMTQEELRQELSSRIEHLNERLCHPKVVYEDEINLYADLFAEEAAAKT